MTIIAVTQPYVPAYRVPLFNAIEERLQRNGLELRVYSAAPRGQQSQRGDSASGRWHRHVESREIAIGKWTVSRRSLPPEPAEIGLVISELEALNIFAWRESFRRRPLILWGHGKGYVNDTSWLADNVEFGLIRRADHVMTYAPSGRHHIVRKGGISPDKVTAIGNSTDTSVLRVETERLLPTVSRDGAPSAMYVGGLDAAKRIDFLLEAFRVAKRLMPNFKLTVVGRGRDEALVRALASDEANLNYVPEARGAELARLGSLADVMWVPGRVGLVAVDSLAMGLPVHTTNFDYHAPEIEFLSEGEVFYLGPTAERFARQSLDLIEAGKSKNLRHDIPTIDKVATSFANVVFSCMKVG